jgi:hypothetical protein
MPRYFFNIDAEQPDQDGVELADCNAARSEAVKAAGEILRDLDGAFPQRDWIMHVEDDLGGVVLELRFSVKERSL